VHDRSRRQVRGASVLGGGQAAQSDSLDVGRPGEESAMRATPARLLTGTLVVALAAGTLAFGRDGKLTTVDIGSRRELFVDALLVDKLDGLELMLHRPTLAGRSTKPRPAGHYATVIKDGDRYRFYCRGYKKAEAQRRREGWEAHHAGELTLYAESRDGVHWTKPNLGLYRVDRYPEGNVVLAETFLVNHNFTPFVDTRPNVPADQRYKALGGLRYGQRKALEAKYGPGGLHAFVSADGIHWKKLQDQPVIPEDWGAFDSQNVAFWSEAEQRYACYFRTFVKGYRSISRCTSRDFVHWTKPTAMNANLPGEHLYTNGTHPYFRAPHIYVALPTRFMAGRGSITDVLFMTSRGGSRYDRTFQEAFIRPGLGRGGWGNRSNYAAYHVVPTGPAEMSIYVTFDRRHVLRTDGFASVHAGHDVGEMITRPLTFSGDRLEINYSTSAAGSIRIEMQRADGEAIRGLALEDFPALYGDEVSRVVTWKAGPGVGALAGKPVRLRFVLQDADLYSLRFFEAKPQAKKQPVGGRQR
jgi:hypothetical protein